MRFAIPIRTVSEANRREHWAAKAKRAKAQRGLAGALTRLNLINAEPCKFDAPRNSRRRSVTLTRVAPRKLDTDNLARSLKAVRDGIADALGIDDGDERVAWLYAQRRGAPKTHEVEVEIREEA